ncbi:MAG: hypothetical protein Q9207_003466 [Kuettlingeria erythrocarpa]
MKQLTTTPTLTKMSENADSMPKAAHCELPRPDTVRATDTQRTMCWRKRGVSNDVRSPLGCGKGRGERVEDSMGAKMKKVGAMVGTLTTATAAIRALRIALSNHQSLNRNNIGVIIAITATVLSTETTVMPTLTTRDQEPARTSHDKQKAATQGQKTVNRTHTRSCQQECTGRSGMAAPRPWLAVDLEEVVEKGTLTLR